MHERQPQQQHVMQQGVRDERRQCSPAQQRHVVLTRHPNEAWIGCGCRGALSSTERHGASAHPIRRAMPPALRNGLGAAVGHGDRGADAALGGLNVSENLNNITFRKQILNIFQKLFSNVRTHHTFRLLLL